MNQRETIALARVLKQLEGFTYADSSLCVVGRGPGAPPEGKPRPFDEVMRERTRLWRESWILPELRTIVERYAKKNRVRLEAVRP